MNELLINGYILRNTEKNTKNYVFHESVGEKKSYLYFLLSSNVEGAKKDEKGYFPTEVYRAKAFGKTAEQINKNFGEGKYIIFKGAITKEKARTGNDGTEYPESVMIIANKIIYGGDHSESAANKSTASTTTTAVKPPMAQTIEAPF